MTENEGKIKKRILTCLNELTLSATFKPNTNDWQNQTVPVTIQGIPESFLDKILDDTAKDFPDENDEKYKDRDIPMFPDQKGGDYYRFRHDKYIDDVQEWFKEHFGSRISKLSSAKEPQQS